MEIRKRKVNAIGTKLFVRDNGQEIARAYLYVLNNDLHDEPFGFIEDVFVEESRRGQGLGTKITKALIKEAKMHNCYKLIACSRQSRDKVHNLYKKIGFTEHGKEFRINIK
jgi:GNAT superfamily N-acetyltransferase